MLLDVNSILILVGIGLFAGVVNTLAGGGSLVTLPVLILFLGMDEVTANGTNRLMIIFSAFVANYGYSTKGIKTFPYGIYLGLTALIGAIIGASIAVDIDGDTFKRFLAIIMISIGLIIDPRTIQKPTIQSTFPSRAKINSAAREYINTENAFIAFVLIKLTLFTVVNKSIITMPTPAFKNPPYIPIKKKPNSA